MRQSGFKSAEHLADEVDWRTQVSSSEPPLRTILNAKVSPCRNHAFRSRHRDQPDSQQEAKEGRERGRRRGQGIQGETGRRQESARRTCEESWWQGAYEHRQPRNQEERKEVSEVIGASSSTGREEQCREDDGHELFVGCAARTRPQTKGSRIRDLVRTERCTIYERRLILTHNALERSFM
nr:hypothetical protein CFP56_10347 [Quercus suber]